MHEHEVRQELYVDVATAQQAIALAARLQEEHDQQVSLTELHRAAAEAGIRPDSLELALAKLTTPTEQPREVSRIDVVTVVSAIAVTLLGLMFALAHIRATSMLAFRWQGDSPWIALFLALAIGLASPVGRKSKGMAWIAGGLGVVWLLAAGYFFFMSWRYQVRSSIPLGFVMYALLGLKEAAAMAIGALARRGFERLVRKAATPRSPTQFGPGQV